MDKTELKKAFEKMDVHVTDKEVDLLLKRYKILHSLFYKNRPAPVFQSKMNNIVVVMFLFDTIGID